MGSKNIYICDNYDEYDFNTERIWRIDGEYEPFVYIIQEVSTGIMYIGSKTQKGCLESWLGTKYFTSSNYVKWIDDEFSILDILKCGSNHDALILEEILITQNNAVKNENYYNKNCNGALWNLSGLFGEEHPAYNRKDSEETRKKKALSKIGDNNPWRKMEQSADHKRKNSESNRGENNAMYGKKGKDHPAYAYKHTEEECEKRRKLRIGWKHSEETLKKIGEASRGRTHSEETIEKLRRASSQENNIMFGKNHTKEARKKMSDAAKNRPKKKCPYCDIECAVGAYSRWHGNNCKHKK